MQVRLKWIRGRIEAGSRDNTKLQWSCDFIIFLAFIGLTNLSQEWKFTESLNITGNPWRSPNLAIFYIFTQTWNHESTWVFDSE